MRRCKQIGLVVAILVAMLVVPFPDGQSVSHPPLVITADTSIFKVKIKERPPALFQQSTVYCGVTSC